jgi:hypothetical protein
MGQRNVPPSFANSLHPEQAEPYNGTAGLWHERNPYLIVKYFFVFMMADCVVTFTAADD